MAGPLEALVDTAIGAVEGVVEAIVDAVLPGGDDSKDSDDSDADD